jgi:hypothetical protein
MSEERKKEIDDCIDLLERAKAILSEMKSADEADLEAMEEEEKEGEEAEDNTDEID